MRKALDGAHGRTLWGSAAWGRSRALTRQPAHPAALDRLRRFDVDVLKLDRAFVRGLGTHASEAAIVDAIVVMAHALDLTVTAEGVDDEAQLAELRELGCDAAQGFLFAGPAPAEELRAWLLPAAQAA